MCDAKNENTNEISEAIEEAKESEKISVEPEMTAEISNDESFSEDATECDVCDIEENEPPKIPAEFPKKQSPISSAFDYLETLVFAACAVLLLFSAFFRLCSVDGSSMDHTLKNGEMLVISDVMYAPENGDIVVFHQTDDKGLYNKPLVKRVIATEGQWIYIEYGINYEMSVYVSDDEKIDESDLIDEPYANLEPGPASYQNNFKAQVPKGCVFVMGDHRYNSADSRSHNIGFVDCRRILGKVLLRVTPLSKFGAVD